MPLVRIEPFCGLFCKGPADQAFYRSGGYGDTDGTAFIRRLGLGARGAPLSRRPKTRDPVCRCGCLPALLRATRFALRPAFGLYGLVRLA